MCGAGKPLQQQASSDASQECKCFLSQCAVCALARPTRRLAVEDRLPLKRKRSMAREECQGARPSLMPQGGCQGPCVCFCLLPQCLQCNGASSPGRVDLIKSRGCEGSGYSWVRTPWLRQLLPKLAFAATVLSAWAQSFTGLQLGQGVLVDALLRAAGCGPFLRYITTRLGARLNPTSFIAVERPTNVDFAGPQERRPIPHKPFGRAEVLRFVWVSTLLPGFRTASFSR